MWLCRTGVVEVELVVVELVVVELVAVLMGMTGKVEEEEEEEEVEEVEEVEGATSPDLTLLLSTDLVELAWVEPEVSF